MAASEWEEFAAKVNQARSSRHLSISAAAKIAGVPKATAQGWLSGRHQPTPALRARFATLVESLELSSEFPAKLWQNEWDLIEPQLRVGRGPYLGLRHFTPADSEVYFGRAEESKRLALQVAQLRKSAGHGVIAVIGPSGSGKSSLLAAGLIGGEMVSGDLAGWQVAVLAPSAMDTVVDDVDAVIVDQFEEVFGLPDVARSQAMDALGRLAEQRIVVVALRSDFFADAETEPVLNDALGRAFLIAPLTRSSVRQMILGPAGLAGLRVDDELVAELIAELAPGSGRVEVPPQTLPLLSTALMVTWASGDGQRMTLEDYQRTGGVSGAVETLAEQVFADLDSEQQILTRKLFMELVGLNDNGYFRRSVALAELSETMQPMMSAFVTARMLTIDRGEVQITHDVLLHSWRRLAEWLESHADALRLRARLHRAAQVWEEADRDPHALIPVDSFLSEAGVQPAELGALESAFIHASSAYFASELQAEQQTNRRLKNQRRLAVALAMVTTVAAAGTAIGFVRSEGYRGDAITARNEAQSRQLATAARGLRSKSPNLAAQLALVSHRIADTQEARSALLEAASSDVPVRWLGQPYATSAVSSDGNLVARADSVGTISLWRGAELTTTPGASFLADENHGALLSIAIAEIGGRSILAVGGTTVRSLWDVSVEPTKLVDLDPSTATAVAFNPQGDKVAFGDDGGGVTVYDLTALEQPRQFARIAPGTDASRVTAVALDRRNVLYVAGRSGIVDRWQLAAKPKKQTPLQTSIQGPDGRLPVRAQSLALSPAGNQLAAGLAGTEVARWRIGDGDASAPLAPLTAFTEYVNGVAYSADGAQIGVASSDQSISVFTASSGDLERKAYTDSIQTTVGFSASGAPVSTGNDGSLLVWPLHDPLWKRSGAVIYNLSAENSGWLAGGSSTDGIALWQLGEAPQRMPKPVPPALSAGDFQVGAVAVSPNGRFLLGSTMLGQVLSWPLTPSGAGAGKACDSGVGTSIIFTAVSADSSLVAAMAQRASQVVLFHAASDGTLTRLTSIPVPSEPQLVGLNARGDLLAIAELDNTVTLWSVSDPLHPVQLGAITGLGSTPTSFDLAPTSDSIAVGEHSGTLSLWDLTDPTTPTKVRSWTDAGAFVYSVEFSPDETQLLATSGDDVVWGWALDSSQSGPQFALDGEVGRPWDVRFLDQDHNFAVAGDLGAVQVWNSDVEATTQSLCSRIGEPLTAEEWQRYLPGVAEQPVC